MGWNDRLPEDPYIPPPEYYQDRAEYEAWLDYIEMRLAEDEQAGLTSQNLDPAMLSGNQRTTQESPKSRGVLSRLWAAIFGQHSNIRTGRQNSSDSRQNSSDSKKEEEAWPF